MSIKHLDVFFNPRSIAVIGASEDNKAIGYRVLRNLIGKGFKGIVYPVNPRAESVQGILSYKNINDIPYQVDLAIVASHPETFHNVLDECGHKNVKGVIILSLALESAIEDPEALHAQIKEYSLKYGYRILGPNSFGFLRPNINLNASLLPKSPSKGNIAFISQGGIFASAFLERAIRKNIGFSYYISLGDKLDITISDLVDFMGIDPNTRAIVIHVQEIKDGRRFMTAVRSFANSKPIMIVKSGHPDASSSISLAHSGILVSQSKIYEAAFKRAGAVKVNDMVDLLYMIETLAKQNRPKGKRLAVISNSMPPADMAADILLELGGELAGLENRTSKSKRNKLPVTKQINNPIYLDSDALPADYMTALKNCLTNEDVDGILVIHVPFHGIDPKDIAVAIASAATTNPQVPIFTTWLGDETVLGSKEFLYNKNIPTYFTPEQAVKCFMYMHQYDKNLQLLRETPEIILKDFTPDIEKAEGIMRHAAKSDRQSLHLDEAAEILEAYGMPVAKTLRISNEEDAVREAERIGYPVVLKIDSGTVPHKLIHVNLNDAQAVREAFVSFRKATSAFGESNPDVILQQMIVKQGCELAIGAKDSLNFGKAIVFGMGGVFRGAMKDYSIGLPPLNQTLARHLMEDTKIYQYLKGLNIFKASLRHLEQILVRFSQLIVDFPQIKEIDINPFLLTEKSGIVLNASITIDLSMREKSKWSKGDLFPPHLAIPPYPFKYVRELSLKDGSTIIIRPIRGEDEPAMSRFFESLSDESVAFRFCQQRINMPHEVLVRFCQVDYDRDLAFIAFLPGNEKEIIGDMRMNKLPDLESAELSFAVSDQWQGKGVGNVLMDYCVSVAKEIGLKSIWMEILKKNLRMINFSRKYGFKQASDDEDMIRVVLQL